MPYYLNPDYLRWELHRVWVVEATLAPGKRHVVRKRVFYADEDTWAFCLSDSWDARGKIWKFIALIPLTAMEIPATVPQTSYIIDFIKGYALSSHLPADRAPFQYKDMNPYIPEGQFAPEALSGSGVR